MVCAPAVAQIPLQETAACHAGAITTRAASVPLVVTTLPGPSGRPVRQLAVSAPVLALFLRRNRPTCRARAVSPSPATPRLVQVLAMPSTHSLGEASANYKFMHACAKSCNDISAVDYCADCLYPLLHRCLLPLTYMRTCSLSRRLDRRWLRHDAFHRVRRRGFAPGAGCGDCHFCDLRSPQAPHRTALARFSADDTTGYVTQVALLPPILCLRHGNACIISHSKVTCKK